MSLTSLPLVAFLSTLVLLIALTLSQFELYFANIVGGSIIESTLANCQAQLNLCQSNGSALASDSTSSLPATGDGKTAGRTHTSLSKPRKASVCASYATPIGTWVALHNSEGRADTWVPLDPACKLHDYVTDLVEDKPTPLDDKAILLIGDSLDKYILRDFCHAASGRKEPGHSMVRYVEVDESKLGECCSYPNDEWTCTKTKLRLGTLWQFGVHLQGPYYVEEKFLDTATKLPTLHRIMTDGPRFGKYIDRQPDQVVYRSLFWDLARMSQHMPEELNSYWRQESSEPVLNFVKNMTVVMGTIKQAFPGASSFVFVTAPCPQEGVGYHFRRYIGKLNVAGRRAAEISGFTVVDLDMMVLEMTVGERTFDGKHPNEDVNRNLLNIYLNVLRQAL